MEEEKRAKTKQIVKKSNDQKEEKKEKEHKDRG